MDDQSLLRQYAQDRSETAFTELVERHIRIVYSTALRRVGEPHLAQDVVQTVFIELARKPWSIRDPRALAGWLYRAANHTASNILRTESRRRKRENDAMNQNVIESHTSPEWQQLQPHLDEAIQTLGSVDQNVIALRFLEGKSLRETGQSLSMSEDAVQKRASRALGKLRDFFAQRGITMSAAALGNLITANLGGSALPADFSVKITRSALAAAGSGGIILTLMKLTQLLTSKQALGTLAAAALATTWILAKPAAPEKTAKPPESVSIADSSAGVSPQPVRVRFEPKNPNANDPNTWASVATPAQDMFGRVKLAGHVVDDLTGEPVNDYALEWGMTDSPVSRDIVWGYGKQISSPRYGGRFQIENGTTTGSKVWLRVLADGYAPQPVTPRTCLRSDGFEQPGGPIASRQCHPGYCA